MGERRAKKRTGLAVREAASGACALRNPPGYGRPIEDLASVDVLAFGVGALHAPARYAIRAIGIDIRAGEGDL